MALPLQAVNATSPFEPRVTIFPSQSQPSRSRISRSATSHCVISDGDHSEFRCSPTSLALSNLQDFPNREHIVASRSREGGRRNSNVSKCAASMLTTVTEQNRTASTSRATWSLRIITEDHKVTSQSTWSAALTTVAVSNRVRGGRCQEQ